MDIGQKIKGLRLKKNLSADEFAKQLQTTRQTIYNYENNRLKPKPEKIKLIAKFFDLTVDEFLKDIGTTENSGSALEKEIIRLNSMNESLINSLQMALAHNDFMQRLVNSIDPALLEKKHEELVNGLNSPQLELFASRGGMFGKVVEVQTNSGPIVKIG